MNPENNERLLSCFKTVFPSLPVEELLRASTSSIAMWDSVVTVTLVSLVEDEFDIEVSDEDLENFVSFELVSEIVSDELQ